MEINDVDRFRAAGVKTGEIVFHTDVAFIFLCIPKDYMVAVGIYHIPGGQYETFRCDFHGAAQTVQVPCCGIHIFEIVMENFFPMQRFGFFV